MTAAGVHRNPLEEKNHAAQTCPGKPVPLDCAGGWVGEDAHIRVRESTVFIPIGRWGTSRQV